MIKKSKKIDITSNKLFRYILIFIGTVFLGFGIIGIFLPILPTTPFLLLSAACYARSSQRFYLWLMNNKWFGTYIKNYQEGRGIPLKFKIFIIALLWLTIIASIFFISILWVRLILIIIVIAVTIHIITIKTLKNS